MKVLLTGSSKGIGLQIAKDLLSEGHTVVLHYNNSKSNLETLHSKFSSNSYLIKADLNSVIEVENLVNETINKIYT